MVCKNIRICKNAVTSATIIIYQMLPYMPGCVYPTFSVNLCYAPLRFQITGIGRYIGNVVSGHGYLVCNHDIFNI